MKIDLTQTSIGRSSNVSDYASNARAFLLENIEFITFDHDEERRLLKTQDRFVKTVMSDLYLQMIEEDKSEIFTLLTLDQVRKIPSWFLISWLDIDTLILKQTDVHSYNTLSGISRYRNKILVDITPYYSRKKNEIVDSNGLYSRIVRNLLCRSYFQSDKLWLSPGLIYLLTKFYAMILGSKIGRMYNLSIQEQFVVSSILSVYFVNRCSNIPDTINPLMYKMEFLGRMADVKSIYNFISENYTVETFDLQAAIDTIVKLGPSRISKFNLKTFQQMMINLTSNQSISLIALEYPPYWAYIILSAISGEKTNTYHTIKNLNLRKESLDLHKEMIQTKSFIRSL